MTRQDIENDYSHNGHGLITDPGKFEGQMLYAPYLYNALNEGDGELLEGDENGGGSTSAIEISADDKKEFPELEGFATAIISESSDGFITVDLTNQSIDELQSEAEPDEEDEGDEEE
jgi:hypothetical protein